MKIYKKFVPIKSGFFSDFYVTFDSTSEQIIGGYTNKFSSVSKLFAYAEFYPKNRQSGESINSKTA